MRRKNALGWGELVIGLLLIALGIFTLVRPEGVLTGTVVLYGVIAVALGIEDIVAYVRLSRFTGFGLMLSLVSGILSVMCGVMLVANPNLGKWALTILVPVWFITHCISGLAHAAPLRLLGDPFYYALTLTLNILGLLLGLMMLFSPALSFLTLRAVSLLVGIYLLLFGLESVIAAFLRRNSDW